MFPPPLAIKTAEPPPPEGVSSKEWDRILQEGPPPKMPKNSDVQLIRKTAERLAFEELTSPATGFSNPEWNIIQLKQASVEDPELFNVASLLARQKLASGGYSLRRIDIFDVYEELGGKYKHAFGAPMFNAQQMAGSPATSGGMAARAKTPGPQIQSAPVSVTTTTIGQNSQQGGTSAPGGVSAPSAPSATTGG